MSGPSLYESPRLLGEYLLLHYGGSETLRHEMESAKADLTELEELRELKADVERKERQQAVIIEGQVCLGRLR